MPLALKHNLKRLSHASSSNKLKFITDDDSNLWKGGYARWQNHTSYLIDTTEVSSVIFLMSYPTCPRRSE